MGRIFAAASLSRGRSRGDTPVDRVQRMTEHPAVRATGMSIFTGSTDGAAAAGLIAGPALHTGAVSQKGHGEYVISFYGYMPGLEDILSENGIVKPGDPGAGIIDLYLKEGDRFLELLPGMFALALYDGKRQVMLVAGDRSGYCPVYYSRSEESICFSSATGPLTATREWNGLERGSAIEYLMFDAIYGSRTIYSDINIIPFGEYIRVDLQSGTTARGRYFSYESMFDIDIYNDNRKIDAPAVLTETLKGSIRRMTGGRETGRMGLLCGGGVDCSLIGALLKEEGVEVPIFCATVEGGEVSEDEMARVTSERLGSEISIGSLSQRKYYPMLLRSIVDFAQPIAHPNLARFYVNAALSTGAGRPEQILGVASDLLFAGQSDIRSFHKYQTLSKYLSFLPEKVKRIFTMAAGNTAETDLAMRLRSPLSVLAAAGMGNLERAATGGRIAGALAGIEDTRERSTKILMVENLCDYQQHLLNRRYEMAARSGMELLFPFLDLEVVRFAVNLPVSHCVDWSGSKKVVRAAAKAYLGNALSSRAKWGGDVPTRKWIAPLRPLLDGGFLADQLQLETASLEPVFKSDPKILWNMIDLELWGRLCLYGEDPEKILEAIRKNGPESDTFESVQSR